MTWTARLKKAMDEGALIVCSMQPHQGWPVGYSPRSARDPQPWTCNGVRYSGRECHIDRGED